MFYGTITPSILVPFYAVLKRYVPFWLSHSGSLSPLSGLKLPLFQTFRLAVLHTLYSTSELYLNNSRADLLCQEHDILPTCLDPFSVIFSTGQTGTPRSSYVFFSFCVIFFRFLDLYVESKTEQRFPLSTSCRDSSFWTNEENAL